MDKFLKAGFIKRELLPLFQNARFKFNGNTSIFSLAHILPRKYPKHSYRKLLNQDPAKK